MGQGPKGFEDTAACILRNVHIWGIGVPFVASQRYQASVCCQVYSMSALYEQSTPEVLEINDTVAKVGL